MSLLLLFTEEEILGWKTKTKILQQRLDVALVTPDGEEILVGAHADDVVLIEEGFNNWKNKIK